MTDIVTLGGQCSVDGDGRLVHEGDVAAQLALAVANLTDVLAATGMTPRDLAHLRIHTTDMAALREVLFVVDEQLASEGSTPPMTVVEVGALRVPNAAVEIDALAVREQEPIEGSHGP